MQPNPSIKEDLIQQQILQAAQQLFQKHGYQKVTMDDVAKAIGKGRSSLYYHYKNEDEVFEAVMEAEFDDIIAEMSRAVEKADSVEEKLKAFALTKTKINRKKCSFFAALESGMSSDEISEYHQRKHGFRKKLRKDEADMLCTILPESDNRETVIFIFMHSVRGIYREMQMENNYSNLERVMDTLVQMTLSAIP